MFELKKNLKVEQNLKKFMMKIQVLISLTLFSFCQGLCPLVECECDDNELKVECLGMTLREVPITLNPHIATLRITDSQLKRLDAALQFYPHLRVSMTTRLVKISCMGGCQRTQCKIFGLYISVFQDRPHRGA